MYIDSLKKEIGEAVYYTIIKATNELCSTGLYQNDEKQDLIHDFILLCLTTKNNADLNPQALIPYLVLCVRNYKIRLLTVRKRERLTFTTSLNQMSGVDNDFPDNRSDDIKNRQIVDDIVDNVIKDLNEPAYSIIQYLLEKDCSPEQACKAFGKNHMYYYRTIMPILKKKLKKLLKIPN